MKLKILLIYLSEKTVRNYVSSILSKLHLSTRAEGRMPSRIVSKIICRPTEILPGPSRP